MTRARAPGKLVLSGAYAVLSGAPAIVTAAARYVLADTGRAADLVTPEVAAALGAGQRAPFFDASELRENGRKLGLGSSAAILLASLFAIERERSGSSDAELRQLLFPRALVAHRTAQGGGSGVDVAASCFGGTLIYELTGAEPRLKTVSLPPGLVLEVWVCPTSASTRQLIAAVDDLKARAPSEHERWLSAQSLASRQAVQAVEGADTARFIAALVAQFDALRGLGEAAQVPIVTPELCELSTPARLEGGVLLPAGAGGGDIAIFAGESPSSAALRGSLEQRSHRLLDVALSAAGVGSA